VANFAKLDANNTVLEVLFVHNNELLDDQGQEREELGIAFLTMLTRHLYWRQTSYNGTFRKNFAKIGSKYDPVLDAFVDAQPYPSWQLDAATAQWTAPVPRPPAPPDHYSSPGYFWDEPTQTWANVAYLVDGTFIRPEN